METNKYYVPSIEEFHIGFWYEEFRHDEWIKQEIGDATQLEGALILLENYEGTIRTKYLDKQDIESLGFDNYEPPMEYNHQWKYKGSREFKLAAWFNNEIPVVRVYSSYPAIAFHGTIKNKSELQRLLKQLGI